MLRALVALVRSTARTVRHTGLGRAASLVACLAVALDGCFPREDEFDETPGLEVAADTSVLVSGPTAAVHVNATRTGLWHQHGEIAWAVSPQIGRLVRTGQLETVMYFVESVPAVTAVTITASAAGLSDSAVVTVEPPQIEVAPQTVTLTVSAPATFEAALAIPGPVMWSIAPVLGSLSSTTGRKVTYTAPASIATAASVTLTAMAAGIAAGTAHIVLQPAFDHRFLRVTPALKTVRAGGGPVAFTVVRNGVTAETVTWSVDGGSADGTLDAPTGESVTYTPPATAAARRRVSVTARAGDASAYATIELHPPSVVTVAGTVVYQDSLLPISGAEVHIGTSTAVTDEAGRFAIPDVMTPYTVVVAVASPDLPELLVRYDGLTRADPILTTRPDPASRPVRISGTLVGLSPDAALVPVVRLSGPIAATGPVAVDASGAYSADLEVFGVGATSVGVYALEVEMLPELETVARYGRFGRAEASIAAGAGGARLEVAGVDVPLDPDPVPITIAAGDVGTGTVAMPPGMTGRVTGMTSFGDDRFVLWPAAAPAPGSFRMLAPLLPGADFVGIAATVADDERCSSRCVSSPLMDVHLWLQRPPVGISPASGTAAATDPIRWDAFQNFGVTTILYRCGTTDYRLVTPDNEVTLPAIPGHELPSGTECTGRIVVDDSPFWFDDVAAAGYKPWPTPIGACAPAPRFTIL